MSLLKDQGRTTTAPAMNIIGHLMKCVYPVFFSLFNKFLLELECRTAVHSETSQGEWWQFYAKLISLFLKSDSIINNS